MDYARQLQFKQRRVEGLLKQFHSVELSSVWKPLITTATRFPPPLRWHEISRSFPGVYQDSTHRIVPVDHCLIEDPKADEIICSIRRLMKSFKLLPYDEVTQKASSATF